MGAFRLVFGLLWSLILVIIAPVLLVLRQHDEKEKDELRALKEMTGGGEASAIPAWRKAQAEQEAESAAERAATLARREREKERAARRPIRVPKDPGNPNLRRGPRRQRRKSTWEKLSEWWAAYHFPRPQISFRIHVTWDQAVSWISWGSRYLILVFVPAVVLPVYVVPMLVQSGTAASIVFIVQLAVPLGFFFLIAVFALMARRYAGDVSDESRLVSHVRGQEARSRVTRAILPHDTPANRLAYIFMWIELVQIYRITLLDFTGLGVAGRSTGEVGLVATWALVWSIVLLWLFVLMCSVHFGFKPGNYIGYRLLTAVIRGPMILPLMNATFLALVCTPTTSGSSASVLTIPDSSTSIATQWTCWGSTGAGLLSGTGTYASHTLIATFASTICFGLFLPSLFILTIRKHGNLSLIPDDVFEAWDGDDGELERIGLLYLWSGRFVAVDAFMKGVLALFSVALIHYTTSFTHLGVCAGVVLLLILTSIRFPPTTVKVANLLRMFLYVAALYCYACAALAFATVSDVSVASMVGTDPGETLVLPTDNWWPLILLVYGWAGCAVVFFLRAKITTQRLYRRLVGLEYD